MLYFALVGLVSLLVCCFCPRPTYVCAIRLNSNFNRKYIVLGGSFLGEVKEQVQGLLPIDSQLITNIFNNPIQ